MASAYPLFPEQAERAAKILSVSQLSQLIEGTLESNFQSLWVSGEVSEVSRPHSGHVYFTLRDEKAQIGATIWRSVASRLRFQLEDGQHVICHGDIDVYPPRGTYRLVVRQVEPQGLGALQLAFKQLQRRLEAEGLFGAARKRQLPVFPRRVGFVTSPTGAAIRDFLQVAKRRFHGVQILVIPARVQGEGAAGEIARGIELANRLQPSLDVLVVGRGGGSLEDLWCFNEEVVVRAIPSAEELSARLTVIQRRIVSMLRSRATTARHAIEQLARSRVLRNPRALIYDLSQRLDELEGQSRRAVCRRIDQSRDRLSAIACRVEALSPLAVLGRGYSVTTREDDGSVIQDSTQVAAGEAIVTRVAQGQIRSIVADRAQASSGTHG
jgi:exodeoxyribonuclease VII large subunit